MQYLQERQLSSHHGAYHDGRTSDYDGVTQDMAIPSVEGSVQSETTLCFKKCPPIIFLNSVKNEPILIIFSANNTE